MLVLICVLFVSGCVCQELEPVESNVTALENDGGIKRPDVRDPDILRYAGMTVENPMKHFGTVFTETIDDLVMTKDDPWVKFMDRAAEEKDVFKYTTRTINGKTELESVNGVYARPEDDTTWVVVFTQIIKDDCRIPQSVDKFFPVDDDHILIRLMMKKEARKIPICFWPIKEEDTPPPL